MKILTTIAGTTGANNSISDSSSTGQASDAQTKRGPIDRAQLEELAAAELPQLQDIKLEAIAKMNIAVLAQVFIKNAYHMTDNGNLGGISTLSEEAEKLQAIWKRALAELEPESKELQDMVYAAVNANATIFHKILAAAIYRSRGSFPDQSQKATEPDIKLLQAARRMPENKFKELLKSTETLTRSIEYLIIARHGENTATTIELIDNF